MLHSVKSLLMISLTAARIWVASSDYKQNSIDRYMNMRRRNGCVPQHGGFCVVALVSRTLFGVDRIILMGGVT